MSNDVWQGRGRKRQSGGGDRHSRYSSGGGNGGNIGEREAGIKAEFKVQVGNGPGKTVHEIIVLSDWKI